MAFYYPDNPEEIYLKRVMDLPGETIEGYNGIVYIDGAPLLNDYTDQRLEHDFGKGNFGILSGAKTIKVIIGVTVRFRHFIDNRE